MLRSPQPKFLDRPTPCCCSPDEGVRVGDCGDAFDGVDADAVFALPTVGAVHVDVVASVADDVDVAERPVEFGGQPCGDVFGREGECDGAFALTGLVGPPADGVNGHFEADVSPGRRGDLGNEPSDEPFDGAGGCDGGADEGVGAPVGLVDTEQDVRVGAGRGAISGERLGEQAHDGPMGAVAFAGVGDVEAV